MAYDAKKDLLLHFQRILHYRKAPVHAEDTQFLGNGYA